MLFFSADACCKIHYDPQVNILKGDALLCAYYGE